VLSSLKYQLVEHLAGRKRRTNFQNCTYYLYRFCPSGRG